MKRTYLTLDGIRGVAAVLIVVRHSSGLFGGYLPQESFLAVDLFFALSGFVLCAAYEERLDSGMTPAAFMTVRAIRFLPLYLLGLALGATAAILALATGDRELDWLSLAVSFLFGLCFLPSPMYGATGWMLFPLNQPSWSLFFELMVNAAMAVYWRRLSNRMLAAICAVAGLFLALNVARLGAAELGFRWLGLGEGLARVSYSFFAGVLLYRLRGRFDIGLHPVAALLLVVLALIGAPAGTGRVVYELAWILVGFPVLLGLAAKREPGGGASIFRVLGLTSYGVYVLHYPLQRLVGFAIAALAHRPAAELGPWIGVSFVALLLAACWLLDRHFDQPLRRRLMRLAEARGIGRGPESPLGAEPQRVIG